MCRVLTRLDINTGSPSRVNMLCRNETIKACASACCKGRSSGKVVNLAKVDTAGRVTVFPWTTFFHTNGTLKRFICVHSY